MLLCSMVPRALGTHGVRVAAQHPGAPGSGGFSGMQTDWRSRLCLFVRICLLTAHRWQSLPAADTDTAQVMKIELGPALKVYNSILMFRRSQDLAGEDAVSGQEAMG